MCHYQANHCVINALKHIQKTYSVKELLFKAIIALKYIDFTVSCYAVMCLPLVLTRSTFHFIIIILHIR